VYLEIELNMTESEERTIKSDIGKEAEGEGK
jgi:hypothetical protein